tara:strand:- start:1038 stop:1175 length:138 start_codon:yes stop_codon:yes gene_type:complete
MQGVGILFLVINVEIDFGFPKTHKKFELMWISVVEIHTESKYQYD